MRGDAQSFLTNDCERVTIETKDSVYITIDNCCYLYSFFGNDIFKQDECKDSILKFPNQVRTSYKDSKKTQKGLFTMSEEGHPEMLRYAYTWHEQFHGKCRYIFFPYYVLCNYHKGKWHGKFIEYYGEGEFQGRELYKAFFLYGWAMGRTTWFYYEENGKVTEYFLFGRSIKYNGVKPIVKGEKVGRDE